MTDPLVQVFSRIFSMSTLQASFVQIRLLRGLFPAGPARGLINRRFSYKTGILTGLGCAVAGAFLFYPGRRP